MGIEQKQPPIETVLEQKVYQAEKGHSAVTLAVRLVVTMLVVALLLGVVSGLSVIRGSSMEPSLKSRDVVLLYRLGKPRRGDIVVLHRGSDKDHLVKRVIAIGGDEVSIDENGEVLVNGEPEPDAGKWGETHAIEHGVNFPYRVPDGSVFLLGDNREASRDSREWGAILQKEIAGRVIWVIGQR